MAYVTVPKDLTKIKSKVMFNLTKRQLICFSAAVVILFGKRQRWNERSGIVHGACHAAYVFACHVREKRATAGSDYSAICGSEVSSPQRATLSDQQFLCRPCAARAIR